jgi:rfaE bifunctional protein kinase chain/domain
MAEKFHILDDARNIHADDKNCVTFSIGVGHGAVTMQESEAWAVQCLDMALGRGGDQAAVKTESGFRFFGGVSKGVEKKSRAKTRIIAGGRATVSQQIVRVDKECHEPMTEAHEKELLKYIKSVLPKMQGVVLSDYGSGTVTPKLRKAIISCARKQGIPSMVDSRYDVKSFKGISYVKQNDAELSAAVGRSLPDEEAVIEAAQELLQEISAEGVLVTRGELGMILVEKDGAVHVIPVSDKSEVYDVSGAGDTCVAAMILALAAGCSPDKAAELSNIASGIAVRKLGTATVSAEELRRVLEK